MGFMSSKGFRYWCYKVLPLVYDDSLSYYEVLCKVVDYINNIIAEQKEITENFEELAKEVDEIKKEIDDILNGKGIEHYIELIKEWVDANLPDLIGRSAKYVIFGLSNDGHFVAYVPESWNFMNFDTISDTTSELYGHLVMRW